MGSEMCIRDSYLVTPRGYDNKYTSDGELREGQRPARSLVVPGMLEAGEEAEKEAEQ